MAVIAKGKKPVRPVLDEVDLIARRFREGFAADLSGKLIGRHNEYSCSHRTSPEHDQTILTRRVHDWENIIF